MMEANEREQYRAAIHGDRDAFEMIIRTQSRPLFAIAYGILQNREEAEDAVQDALVKAWKSRWRVRDPEKFPAWLASVARHRAHDIFGGAAAFRWTNISWTSPPRIPRIRLAKPIANSRSISHGDADPSFTARPLRCAISKTWITPPLSAPSA